MSMSHFGRSTTPISPEQLTDIKKGKQKRKEKKGIGMLGTNLKTLKN